MHLGPHSELAFVQANLTRIFSQGFTTRPGGQGSGLHGGALDAKALGGALNVHSGGSGLGATFTLELPVLERSLESRSTP